MLEEDYKERNKLPLLQRFTDEALELARSNVDKAAAGEAAADRPPRDRPPRDRPARPVSRGLLVWLSRLCIIWLKTRPAVKWPKELVRIDSV